MATKQELEEQVAQLESHCAAQDSALIKVRADYAALKQDFEDLVAGNGTLHTHYIVYARARKVMAFAGVRFNYGVSDPLPHDHEKLQFFRDNPGKFTVGPAPADLTPAEPAPIE